MYNVTLWSFCVAIVALKRNITFLLTYSRSTCSCQGYKIVECYNGDVRMSSLCTLVELSYKVLLVALSSTKVLRSSCEVPNIVVWLEWNFEFLYKISWKLAILNFTKIHQRRAVLTCANRQTDRRDETSRRPSLFFRMRLKFTKKGNLHKSLYCCCYYYHVFITWINNVTRLRK